MKTVITNDACIPHLLSSDFKISDHERWLMKRLDKAMEWESSDVSLPGDHITVLGAKYTGCDRDEWDYHIVQYMWDKKEWYDFSLQRYVRIDYWAVLKPPPCIFDVKKADDE